MWQLSDQNKERLNHIQEMVKGLWKDYEALPYYFTPHGVSHSKKVNEKLWELAPENKKTNFLKEKDKFILSCAAWLHDIGMIPRLFKDDPSNPQQLNIERYLEIRNIHHERSKKYIEENYRLLGLGIDEAYAIGQICFYHRKKEDITECPEYCRLHAALLRLADAFQIDSSRVDDSVDLYNMLLTMGMPLASEFHWLKSFWIRNIEYDHQFKKVIVHFYLSDKKDKICDQDELINFTLNEIKEEIFLCKNIINRSGLFYINDEDVDYVCGGPPPANLKTKFKQIISQLKLNYTASASEVAEILCDTVVYLINSNFNNSDLALKEVNNYKKNVIKRMVELRPVHILIKKIDSILENILNNQSMDNDQKTSEIKQQLINLKEKRKLAVEKIAKFSEPILNDSGSILLFGYSTIIIESLKLMPSCLKDRVEIYVCECRNKNQYNYENKLIYCDGLKYVEKLHEIGFKKLFLIPDVIAGNLIQRNLIEKILFGANSIDIKEKKIGHTAGHYSIVNSARLNNVPIYIFADSYKFGQIQHNTQERTCNWFTREKDILQRLKKKNIKFMNPREDLLSLDSVKMFITEEGMIPPEKIPKSFLEKIEKV